MNAITEKPVAIAPEIETPVAPAAPPPRNWRKLALRGTAAVLVLGAALIGGSWWYGEGRWIETTDNAYVQGDIAVLSAKIDGDITAILVSDNQRVKAGDPLVAVDPRDWQARRDQAAAALAEAKAALISAQGQVVQAGAAIGQYDAQRDQAQAELARSTADAQRSGSLVSAGWTSRQSNDQAVAALRKAEAGLANAVAQRSWSEQALIVAQTQTATAEARIASAQAQLVLAENNLSYTTIRAPFDGIVGNRAAQVGQRVAPGQQLIAIAPPPERLFVTANFKETQLRHMRPGDRVVLVADIDSSATVTGRVDSFAPATGALFSLLPPENATGNFTKIVQRVPVRIALDAPAPWLRAGLSVTAEVDTRGPAATRIGLLGWIGLR